MGFYKNWASVVHLKHTSLLKLNLKASFWYFQISLNTLQEKSTWQKIVSFYETGFGFCLFAAFFVKKRCSTKNWFSVDWTDAAVATFAPKTDASKNFSRGKCSGGSSRNTSNNNFCRQHNNSSNLSDSKTYELENKEKWIKKYIWPNSLCFGFYFLGFKHLLLIWCWF